MKLINKLTLVFISLCCINNTLASNIIPYVSVTANTSVSGGIMLPANLTNMLGMSAASISAQHSFTSDGEGMWCSATLPQKDPVLTFDLGKEYSLEELHIWNFNRKANAVCGVKNCKIEYSTDGLSWVALPTPVSPGYEVDQSYPFQITKELGTEAIVASNLNDGKRSPILFGGKRARYVQITISKSSKIGSWGGISFGLSEVVFTTKDPVVDIVKVSIDPSKVIETCGNLAFGGCHVPSPPHAISMYPKLIDAGFNNVRSDMWLETVLPSNITYDDYINNVNDVQNPETWNFANLEAAVAAKRAGMKVMMIISYCPAWLAYNGKTSGIPKDMKVYADIVRKVYERYHKYFDFIEIYNEPGYFISIENSPYKSVGAALAEIYMTCVNVVRSITPDMPIGGTSVVMSNDGGVGGSTNRDFFADKRITPDNFNFYSHHVYSDYGIKTEFETVTRVKNELKKFGFENLPIYFTEWSSSISNMADSATYYGSLSHLFVGNCLVNWMRDGLAGAQHWNYMMVPIDGPSEAGISADHHGMYTWNASTKVGKLLPKAYVFKMMSRSLGLGKDENRVITNSNEAGNYVNMAAFINSDDEQCVVLVNNKEVKNKLALSFVGCSGDYTAEQYTVTYTKTGEQAEILTPIVNGNNIEIEINVPKKSVVGIRMKKNN